MKIFIYTIIGIVTVSIIAGFFVVGSPNEERLRRFDDMRIQNLQFLQGEIVNYWQRKERLPETLKALEDDIRGTVMPLDPETNTSYVYEIKGSETFLLCATFSRPSFSKVAPSALSEPVRAPVGYYGPYGPGDTWDHAAGFACFERTIDKELYKPIKQ